MAKSKKNQKVQLANMSEQAIALLSGYSVAITELKKLTDAHKAAVDEIEKKIGELLKESEENKKIGALSEERRQEIEQLVFTLNNQKLRLDVKFRDDKKPFTTAKNAALALIPQSIYDGYVKAWADGNTALWNVDICSFLRATGIKVADATGVQNFANVIRVRCAGSRNASSKKNESGMLLQAKGQRNFDDTVMKCFIDYCVVEKHVLDRAEDGIISRHDFSAQ